MKALQEICDKYKVGDWPDKNSVHSYFPVYEEIFKPYRLTALNVLEIGLMSGESLRMWDEYFNDDLRSTHCNVYGMDCSLKPIDGKADLTQAFLDGYKIAIGDATSHRDIARCFYGIMFDVVIEDANHDLDQQLKIYSRLLPYLNKGSIYIIEDVQDIDMSRDIFESIGGKVIDRRDIKNRYDDVLIIIQ